VINFDNLVVAPLMSVFGVPIVITPVISQPGAAPFLGRGVWSIKTVEIPLENGTILSTYEPHLGIRLADYPIPLRQEDAVLVNGTNYLVFDIQPDGQGAADLTLKDADPS